MQFSTERSIVALPPPLLSQAKVPNSTFHPPEAGLGGYQIVKVANKHIVSGFIWVNLDVLQIGTNFLFKNKEQHA